MKSNLLSFVLSLQFSATLGLKSDGDKHTNGGSFFWWYQQGFHSLADSESHALDKHFLT